MALENLATEFTTTLSGNGGSITAGAASFNVADNLPAGLSTNFRAVIYATGDTTGEVVLVTSVTVKAWTVTRGQETTLGAPAAKGHTDGDSVSVVLTTTGLGKVLSDTTLPTTSAVADTAAAGTGPGLSRVDHTHGREVFGSTLIALSSSPSNGVSATPLRSDATIQAFDATVPGTSALADTANTGVAATAARRDHKHGRESFATNAIVLGTAAAAGAATTPFRSDDTIAAFDGTNPSTQNFSDAPAVGVINFAARRDHKHGFPAASVSFPLTNASDEGFQPNSVANSVLTLHNNASAVNIATLTGTATGSDMTLVVSGDANRGLIINPAGTGTITVGSKSNTGIPLTVIGNSTSQTSDLLDILQNSGGNAIFKFATASSAVNGVSFTGAASGSKPTIAAIGTDSNTGLSITAKGTSGAILLTPGTNSGTVQFIYNSGTVVHQIGGGSAAVNGVYITGTNTGVAPAVTANSSTDTNVILQLNGQGTGGAAVLGTSTNDNAAAGYVGEQILSTLGVGSEVTLTTTTTANVTSISLTAGDWDVTGVVDFDLGAATVTRLQAGSSTTSATLGGQDTFSDDPSNFVTITAINADIIPTWRRSLSTTTTVYLVANATFSVGTVKAYGTIRARRVR